MRNVFNSSSALMAMAMLAAMGPGRDVPAVANGAPPRARRPAPSELLDAQAREIAEHNAEVDRRKAEKKAAKRVARSA